MRSDRIQGHSFFRVILRKVEPQPPLGIPPIDEQTEEPHHDGFGADLSAMDNAISNFNVDKLGVEANVLSLSSMYWSKPRATTFLLLSKT